MYIYIYVSLSLSLIIFPLKNSQSPYLQQAEKTSIPSPHLKAQKRGEMDWLPTITASCHTKRSDWASVEFLGNCAEKHRKKQIKRPAKTQISWLFFPSCHVQLLVFVSLKAAGNPL